MAGWLGVGLVGWVGCWVVGCWVLGVGWLDGWVVGCWVGYWVWLGVGWLGVGLIVGIEDGARCFLKHFSKSKYSQFKHKTSFKYICKLKKSLS